MTKLVSEVSSGEQGGTSPLAATPHFISRLLAKKTWEPQTLTLPRASRLDLWTSFVSLDPPGSGDAEAETHLSEQLSGSFLGAQTDLLNLP